MSMVRNGDSWIICEKGRKCLVKCIPIWKYSWQSVNVVPYQVVNKLILYSLACPSHSLNQVLAD